MHSAGGQRDDPVPAHSFTLYTIWPALLFSGALNLGHNMGSSHQREKLLKTVRFD